MLYYFTKVAVHAYGMAVLKKNNASNIGKVTIRPEFSRTVLYFWVLSWIPRCPGFEVF